MQAQSTEPLSSRGLTSAPAAYQSLQDQLTGRAESQGNGSPAADAEPSGSEARNSVVRFHVPEIPGLRQEVPSAVALQAQRDVFLFLQDHSLFISPLNYKQALVRQWQM